MMGEENAFLYRTGLYLAASASAEFFADIALSPMEAVKVVTQSCKYFHWHLNSARSLDPSNPEMKDE